MREPATVVRTREGFRIDPGLAVPTGVRMRRRGRLLVGAGARIDGGVFLAGALYTQGAVRIAGRVRCRGDVVLGPGARIGAGIESGGDVRILPGGHVSGRIDAAGDVHIFAGTRIGGEVHAGGDIVVWGEAETRTLAPGGRLRTEPFDESGVLTPRPRPGHPEPS